MFKLSNIRRVVATFFIIVGTFFLLQLPFLQFHFLDFFPKIQVVPAILAGSVIVVVALFVFTLLFGRLYCSVICPLGIFQDLIIRLNKTRIGRNKELRKKRRKYKYEQPQSIVRYSILIVVTVATLLGSTAFLIILDPYSIYTRMSTHLFHPIGTSVNNLLALVFNKFDSYAFVVEHYIVPSAFVLIFTILITGIVVILAIKKDRFWCNVICPVGTLLGLVSKIALFRVVVDKQKCISCGKCATDCKSHAINENMEFKIDYSRCISCFNCIDSCDKKHAIKFVPIGKVNALQNTAKSEELNRKVAFNTEKK